MPLNVNSRLIPSTLTNYVTAIAMNNRMSLTHSSVSKTNTRYAAERSFRASVSLLMVIAATHFIPVFDEDHDIRNELKSVSK